MSTVLEKTNDNFDKIKLINNDCMIELKNMKDDSIDCVITDPPYFIDKLDDNWSNTQLMNDKKQSYKAFTKRNEI